MINNKELKLRQKRIRIKYIKVKFIIQIQMLDLEVKNFIQNMIKFFPLL